MEKSVLELQQITHSKLLQLCKSHPKISKGIPPKLTPFPADDGAISSLFF